jgi:iron complex outermembrane receptor protein
VKNLHKTTVSAFVLAAALAAPAHAADLSSLEEIIVTGRRVPGYQVRHSDAGTKTGTPVLETPMAMAAVSEDAIRDLKVPDLTRALENVSGVRPNPSLESGNRFILRGFANGGRIFIDGLTISTGGVRSDFDSAFVERIEVLKGPASVLYGRSEPGGVINMVLKRPLEQAVYALEQQIGSNNTFRTIGDATGPLTESGNLLYRVVGVYQEAKTFRDFGLNDHWEIAPSLTWKIGPSTVWTVSLDYSSKDYIADFGIPVIGTRPAPIPITRSFGDPNDTVDTNRRTMLNSEFSHQFNESIGLRSRFMAGFNRTANDFVNPTPAFGVALQADGRTLNRNIFHQRYDEDSYNTNLDLIGRFSTGGIQHVVLVGADYLTSDREYGIFGNFNTPNPALAIDIFNPTYGIDRNLFTLARTVPASALNFNVFHDEVFGAYAQDQIKIGENLQFLAGVRWDNSKTGRGRGTSFALAEQQYESGVPTPKRNDKAWSPRLAALYKLTPGISTYVSWSRSFGANNGVNAANVPHPPQRAEQYEIGAKGEFMDRKLTAAVALYNLERSNMLTPDLTATTLPLPTIAIGKQRSRGIEFDTSGQIMPGLNVIGSYAYTDAEVTLDNSGLRGKRLVNVPKHAASLALRQEFQSGALAGAFVGGGIYAVGERHGDIQNTFQLPAYVRFDALAGYGWTVGETKVTAQLNVRNLFDRTYYESADGNSNVAPRLGVAPGAPREFLGSIRISF